MERAASETVDDAIERVLTELECERRPAGDGVGVVARGRLFARVAPGRLEVLLDPAVASAALRTPSVQASSRGQGWVVFTPPGDSTSRLDIDRVEAWLRLAHRAASSRT